MRIDLHTHSNASDGQYSPKELVELVNKENIDLFSLTDHDTISGLYEAESVAEELGIQFIHGIEISSQDSEEIHILGYNIDFYNNELKRICDLYSEERDNRGEKICFYLKEKGIDVDYSEVKEYAKEGVVGRPHFARYLIEHKVVNNRNEAFQKYLDTPEFKLKTDRKKPLPREAIDLIHYAGGEAVLAHPGLYHMDDVRKKALIKKLSIYGLDGVECFYSRHSREETELYLSWIREFDIKTTCGSDFHGEKVKSDICLGMEYNVKKYQDLLLIDI